MDIVILALTCFVNILLALIVLLRPKRGRTELTFALMSFFVTVWIVANYQANYPFDNSLFVSDVSNRLAYASGLLFIASAVAFSYVFPVRRNPGKFEVAGLAVIVAIVSMLSVTDLVAGTVYFDSHHLLAFTVGPLLLPFSLFFLFLVAIVIRNLLFTAGVYDRSVRRQARLVMLAITVSASGALLLNVIIPLFAGEWHTTRFGPLMTMILVAVIAYTIVKHGLFDVRLAAVRTIAYGFSLLTLAGIYYSMAFFFFIVLSPDLPQEDLSLNPIHVVFALFLAFLFQPVKQFFDRVTDTIFYRDSYRSEDFFGLFGHLLSSTVDLRGLLVRAADQLALTFKAEQASFFLYYTNSIEHHMSAGTRDHSRLSADDAALLDEYVAGTDEKIFLTEMLPDSNRKVRHMLYRHKIALFMPLRHGEKITGYVLLGEHRRGGYTKRDLNVLLAISNELVIAIQNALSLHEVKELNARLQQRISVATNELRSSSAKLQEIDETEG